MVANTLNPCSARYSDVSKPRPVEAPVTITLFDMEILLKVVSYASHLCPETLPNKKRSY
jgi:hypothetical protein